MPATFAHCLMAQEAIDKISAYVKLPENSKFIPYVQKLGEKNNFAMTGAAGPDYPYTTDLLTTVVVPISHTWANRMHYESTLAFVEEGTKALLKTDKATESLAIRLAWFCGFVSHVVADSYVHPVINSVVGGPYIFTHQEHGTCELIEDIYIFKQLTKEDIVDANARSGALGYLRILEECSDPDDDDRIHPEIASFWKQLLQVTHPHAQQYFSDIDPDRWHYNYKSTVNFTVDPGAIFRHAVNLTGRAYKKKSDITAQETEKYLAKVKLPDGNVSDYDSVFLNAVGLVVDAWLRLFQDIEEGKWQALARLVKDWNLDTGVDESHVDLWP